MATFPGTSHRKPPRLQQPDICPRSQNPGWGEFQTYSGGESRPEIDSKRSTRKWPVSLFNSKKETEIPT